jgi:ubiquinone/menaquinone biosynthesis C-methylase UbiE
MPIIVDKDHPVIRTPFNISVGSFGEIEQVLHRLLDNNDYISALDVLSTALECYGDRSDEILKVAGALYAALPQEYRDIRYHLYQARYFEFGIRPGDRVLDIGSGHLPFPFATHLSDISTSDHSYGRAGVPFRHVGDKPVFECNVENLPFEDGYFDFIYCSHVLEHVHSPEKACLELQRVGKRGFIETPHRAKDLFLNTASVSNHLWAVGLWGQTLEFSQYHEKDIQGLACGVLLDMNCNPQTEREQAFATLLNLRADRINTMAYWEDDFDFSVRRHQEEQCPEVSLEVQSPIVMPSLNLPEIRSGSLKGSSAQNAHSCVFLHTYYDGFIERHYLSNPGLAQQNYENQLSSLLNANFGDSTYYSLALAEQGWTTHDVIINSSFLNEACKRERGYSRSSNEIVIEQVADLKPDVVYCHDMHYMTSGVLQALRPHTKLIVGQIASTFGEINLGLYDIVISSVPKFVDFFREHGVRSYYQPLGFSLELAEKLYKRPGSSRRYPATFIGTLGGPLHHDRTALLETMADDILMWGTGVGNLEPQSPIFRSYQGEAWGEDMFRIIADSFITLNKHARFVFPGGVEANKESANNMRLYEATGCGALLLTDYKPDIGRFFKPGEEIVTYSSVEECRELIRFFMENRDRATAIAEAGRKRTLQDHSYRQRMAQTDQWLSLALEELDERKNYVDFDISNVSRDYKNIGREEIKESHTESWKDATIPYHQRALVRQELDSMYKGSPPLIFTVLSGLLQGHLKDGDSVLEIGCASGYYYEILDYLLKVRIRYTGLDISEAMVELARKFYPSGEFIAAKGESIPFPDRYFHTVISGTVLLHDPHYPDQIRETCRVAKSMVVAHRTPISKINETTAYTKHAYSIETVEFRFNENELLRHFEQNQMMLLNKVEYVADPAQDVFEASYLFQRLN